jgi:tRNA (guanine-N7-)-methyltransferase
MAQKNKLQKFTEFSSFPNSYENFDMKNPVLQAAGGREVHLKGQWNENHFQNNAPIILELACGHGDYTVEMAKLHPHQNFIGVDIKGARIWKGAKTALEQGLTNAAFLRTRIESIEHFFGPDEISQIWITFPDPFERKSKANRRLTSQYFLKKYRQFLKKDGVVHLKTDADSLYAFTLEVIDQDSRCIIEYKSENIYSDPLENPLLNIQTYYEKMHLSEGKTIKYVRFRISSSD